MRTKTFIAILASFLTAIGTVAQTPPSAEQILTTAKVKAAAEHKNIFVVFDASW